MTSDPLLDQLAALHEQAWGWGRSCCEGDADDAADVLQSAYARVAGGRLRPDQPEHLRSWWFGVIRLLARNHRRTQARRRGFSGAVRQEWRLWFGGAPREEWPADECADLRRRLAELPARQREVLHLVFYEDMSIAAAAEIMGVGLGSARTHYERGKRRLRETLDPALHHAHAHSRP